MRLTKIAKTPCDALNCPTVYLTDHDTVVIQGYRVADPGDGVPLPSGETMVEIPRALLIDSAAQLGVRG